MRANCLFLIGVLGLFVGPLVQAEEVEGLKLPLLQGRITLGLGVEAGASDPSGNLARFSGASVMGDYYFGRHAGREGDAAGFRATSGVLLGSRLGLWNAPVAAAQVSSLVTMERHSFSLITPLRGPDAASQDAGTVPYVGLGYSGTSLKGGWGFSADLGLMALNPASAVRFGRVLNGAQSLDDLLRELRPSPMLQLGASYTF